MPQRREVKQDRPQVRLDPDVAELVAESAADCECSLTIATNQLLRAVQVPLDADVAEWVAECAADYECSPTVAANRLLRALRDEPVGAPPAIPVEPAAANESAIAREPQAPMPRALLRRGVNPRAATILAWNRDGDV